MKSIQKTTLVRSLRFWGNVITIAFTFLLSAANLKAKPRSPAPPLPELSPVLWSESFDELYSYGITNAELSLPNGALRESWTGYALQRSGIVTPFVILARETNGHTNVTCGSAGTLRFWIKPYWSSAELGGTGPGTFARLAELAIANEPQAVWSLQVSPDGSTLSLLAQGDAGPVELLTAPIAWRSGVYHLVCLSYGPSTALYVDGRLVAEGVATFSVPPSLAQLVLGSNSGGTCAAEADFDEVYSFGRPLAVDQVGFYYQATRSLLVMDYLMAARERRAQLRAGDTALSLTMQACTLETDTTDVTMAVVPPPFPGGDDPGTNDVPVPASLPKYVDGGFALLPPVFTDSNTLSLTITNFQAEGNQFDLFYTTNLALLPAPALCLTNWAHVRRGDVGQTNFTVVDAPQPECYFRIGTMLDSDHDGIPDAWENLINHTQPNSPDSDLDGLSDWYELNISLTDPRVAESAPTLNSRPVNRCPAP